MRRATLLLVTVGVALMLASGVALAAAMTCTAGVICNGTSAADTITGTSEADTINGLAGNDSISALGRGDKIDGGPNNDTMDGGGGNDSYRFSGDLASFGADRIAADSSGVDTIDFSRLTGLRNSSGISFDLSGPTSPCDPSSPACLSLGGNFTENLLGTRFPDRLTGNALNNKIDGRANWDNVYGRTGNDRLIGGAGGDYMYGETGNDSLDGGDGNNEMSGGDGADELNGGDETDWLFGGRGDDTMNGGLGHDYFEFDSDWGSDTVLDAGSPNTIEPSRSPNDPTTPNLPDLTFNLVSGAGPEVTDGVNTINWSGNVISNVYGGPGDDQISQNSSDNYMADTIAWDWGGGSDTYKGYGPGGPASGADLIYDGTGSGGDKLDLSNFNTSQVDLQLDDYFGSGPSTLVITFADGSRIKILHYFVDNYPNCPVDPGKGLIETISFANGDKNFAQVKDLVDCSSATARSGAVGAKNHR